VIGDFAYWQQSSSAQPGIASAKHPQLRFVMMSQRALKAAGQMPYRCEARHALLQGREHSDLTLGQRSPRLNTGRRSHEGGKRAIRTSDATAAIELPARPAQVIRSLRRCLRGSRSAKIERSQARASQHHFLTRSRMTTGTPRIGRSRRLQLFTSLNLPSLCLHDNSAFIDGLATGRQASATKRCGRIHACCLLARQKSSRWEHVEDDMPRTYDNPLRDRFTQCAATFFAPANIRTPLSKAWVAYHPIGIIVAFWPYSVPQNRLVCVAGTDIAIGDPVLTKHVTIVPRVVVAFEDVVASAGAPSRAWTNIFASGEQIAALIADDRVQGVALTGSEKGRQNRCRAGRQSRQSRRCDSPQSEARSQQLYSSGAGTQTAVPHQLKTQRSVLITKRGATVSMHDAEYVWRHQWARGIRPHGPLSVPSSLQHGTELQRLRSLAWPRNLFGEHATIEELLAPRMARSEESPDNLCACGCGKEHWQHVSRILPNPHGKGFDLVHFWSIACERRWTWTKGRQQLDGRNQAAPMLMGDSCRSSVLASGRRALEFTPHVTPDQVLSLCDLAGKSTIIAFQPAD
jgi:hypothetical protein